MIQIVGIAFAIVICSLVVKKYSNTFSVLLSASGTVIIFILLSDKMSSIVSSVISISASISGSLAYVKLMIKVLGIVLVSQILSNMCRDYGEGSLSSMVEISARIIVITMILPLFENIISIVTGLLK